MTVKTAKPLTGRKVLAITVAAFGVILAANMAMLFAALGSFPGLEVKNSYVASQSFDRDRAAQAALGWTAKVTYAPGRLTLVVTDAQGGMVTPQITSAIVSRPTHIKDDQILAFAPGTDGLVSPVQLAPGNWQLRLQAQAPDGTRFLQRLDLTVPDRS